MPYHPAHSPLVRPVDFEPTKALSKTLPHPAETEVCHIPLTVVYTVYTYCEWLSTLWRRDGRIELQPLPQSIRFQGGARPSLDNPPMLLLVVIVGLEPTIGCV